MNSAEKEQHSLTSILELIGDKLYELRLKKGYSSHADFTREYGLPRIQYWRMEKGKANITLKSLNKILHIHGMAIEDLFEEIVRERVNGSRKKKH